MPQKKNPDVAELMRGKTGRAYGALFSLLTVLKGLPMTYNRDLQEDKESFLDQDRTVSMSLAVMAGMMGKLAFSRERMAAALARGFLNATELADYLVGKGVPFRKAHRMAGSAVALAEKQGVGLEELSLEALRGISPSIGDDVFAALDVHNAVARRNTPGGTGPASVAAQIAAVKQWLKESAGS
jgi:argininosuccinate lyase